MKTLLLARVVAFVALSSLAPPASAAKPDMCGNGRVQAGEWCDTGGDSPTCDADCSPVDCGDGHVNAAAGEACDTAGESPTCDADCTLPACGDSHVNPAAGEECDGNTPAGVTCVNCALACAAPAASCTDGAKNGAETDVDCGGGCAPCALGMQCLADTDCLTASCVAGVCAQVQGTPSLVVLTPVPVAFGNVLVGTTASLAVTVGNAGSAPLIVSSIVVTSAEFSVDLAGPFTVAPQHTQSVFVRFAPTTVGMKMETLTFSTNTSPPTTSIALLGTGI